MKRVKITVMITILLFALTPTPAYMTGSANGYTSPGVFVQEISNQPPAIEPVETSIAGFLGQTEMGPVEPQLITTFEEYVHIYGGNPGNSYYLPDAVKGYFNNGGTQLYVARVTSQKTEISAPKRDGLIKTLPMPLLKDYLGNKDENTGVATGLCALGLIDEISILYSPDAQSVPGLNQAMIDQCETLKDRMVILESALSDSAPHPLDEIQSSFAAYYTPWLKLPSSGRTRLVPPGGFIAGTYAKNDVEKGVYKTPSNIQLNGVVGLERTIGSAEQGNMLNSRINPIILKSGRGIIANTARTLSKYPEYTYVNLRRYINYLEESISTSLEYYSMEAWNPTVSSQIKSTVEYFLNTQWRNNALMGTRPQDAYFVKVSPSTDSQDNTAGQTIYIEVGVALLKPAEFHIIRISVATE